MEAPFVSASSLRFLVQVAHMRHRPACYLPIPFGGIVSWAHAATGPRHPRKRLIENPPERLRHARYSPHPPQPGRGAKIGKPGGRAPASVLSDPTPGHGIPRGWLRVGGPKPASAGRLVDECPPRVSGGRIDLTRAL